MSSCPVEEELWQERMIQPKTGRHQFAGVKCSPSLVESTSKLPVEYILFALTEKQGIKDAISAAVQEIILNTCINIQKS